MTTEKVKLHRCKLTMFKSDKHTCHTVQRALEEHGIEHEVVLAPMFPRSRRKDVERATGQHMLPAIEFSDGSGYREEGADMAREIAAGRLFAHRTDAPASGA
jgi:glutaredoxin